jgi:hypothetical protein
MKACMHRNPIEEGIQGTNWPIEWLICVEAIPT